MSGAFGEVLFGRSKFVFWALAPFLIGAAVTFALQTDAQDPTQAAVGAALVVAALLLLLSLWPYHRVPGVRRCLTGTVGLAYAAYVFDAWYPGVLPGAGAGADRVPATIGFLVIGVPCCRYTLIGRFRSRPAPLVIPDDEPLLLAAYEAARASLDRMRSAFELCPGGVLVRIGFVTDHPHETSEDEPTEYVVEHIWGLLLALDEREAHMRIVVQPDFHSEPLGELSVPLDEIEDWEAEYEDGSIEGGFTMRAMHDFALREGEDVPTEVLRRLRRYRDAG